MPLPPNDQICTKPFPANPNTARLLPSYAGADILFGRQGLVQRLDFDEEPLAFFWTVYSRKSDHATEALSVATESVVPAPPSKAATLAPFASFSPFTPSVVVAPPHIAVATRRRTAAV